ncbi:MAG: pantetheine-phosphate adenylyltransferase [Lachnospiraceae bacterium]|nr:pantetheine-phosphate adenylyltransferase [Lachnospiraceae bacterium]MDY5497535.1 pantetheine-phosphate adenylyltransferase [Anaerobutyricum sp.]
MATAVYPGSFDPITLGHLDIIERAAEVFDKVVVGVLINQTKKPLFTIEERVAMIREVTREIPNVQIQSFNGLLVDFSAKMKADVIVRGIRAVSDFEYELMMAQTNKELNPDIETMFFATSAKYSFLSSSTIRELAAFDGDITQFVPEAVSRKVYEKISELDK